MRPALSAILAASVALLPASARADEPTPAPAPEPSAPEPPAEAPPDDPPSDAPQDPPQAPASVAPTPSPTAEPTAEPPHEGVEAAWAPAGSRPSSRPPTLALELAAANALNQNPYLQHQGWDFETGDGRGLRLEAHWHMLALGVETSSMANERACGVGCFEGDFGRTTFTSLDLGFRFRFGRLGPVRPFLAGAIGGVRASSGEWAMETTKTVYGGLARATAGIELPFAGRFFASGQIGYRFIVTENPLRDPDQDALTKAMLGVDTTDGTYAEDAHQILLSVGIGVAL